MGILFGYKYSKGSRKMNNFVIKFCTTQVHLLGVRQVNNWYAIKIYEKLIAQSPNEFKYPKSNYHSK